jgi:hypothetical protein
MPTKTRARPRLTGLGDVRTSPFGLRTRHSNGAHSRNSRATIAGSRYTATSGSISAFTWSGELEISVRPDPPSGLRVLSAGPGYWLLRTMWTASPWATRSPLVRCCSRVRNPCRSTSWSGPLSALRTHRCDSRHC